MIFSANNCFGWLKPILSVTSRMPKSVRKFRPSKKAQNWTTGQAAIIGNLYSLRTKKEKTPYLPRGAPTGHILRPYMAPKGSQKDSFGGRPPSAATYLLCPFCAQGGVLSLNKKQLTTIGLVFAGHSNSRFSQSRIVQPPMMGPLWSQASGAQLVLAMPATKTCMIHGSGAISS